MPRITFRRPSTAALAVVLAAASFTVVASQAPVRPPATGAPALNLTYEKFRLANGLTVIVHEDRKAPIVATSIYFRVGSKNEPAGKTGFAHLFEHLLFNGSEHYDGEWFEPLQEVGATDVNGSTWLDRTNYFQTVPTPALDRVLWMESDRMGHLLGAVTQTKLDNQRGVVQNEKRQGDNRPYGRLGYRMMEGLFPPGHPYRHSTIGSMEDLDAASLEDVHEWFRRYYGPNNAVLVLAGDIDVATARAKVERYFGHIAPGPPIDAFQMLVPEKSTNTAETMHDNVPAVLVQRVWAVAGRNERERALLDLAAAVMGSGRNSRLYRAFIFDRQLATSASASVTPFDLSSVFSVSVVLNQGQTADVASPIVDEVVSAFLEDGPTADELSRVVASINASTIRGLEQVGGFAGKAVALAEGEMYAGDPLFIEKYLGWINAATPAEVHAAAKSWLGRGWHQVNVVPNPQLSADGQNIDRSTGLPPVPTDMPTLSFPAVQTARLSNGIPVVLAERRAMPLVELSLQFDAGYAADAGAKLGLASFTMSMLDTGTTTRTSLQISEEAERLGANVSAGANLDASVVSLSALKAQVGPSIDLWADVTRNPVFDQTELDRLRGRWLSSIAQEKAQPASLALRLLPPVLYGPGHAYAVPFTGSGTVASISSLTRDDLVAFTRTWLRPDNASIFVAGDTTLAEVMPLLEKAFGGWATPPTPKPTKNVANVKPTGTTRIVLVDRPGSPQSLILGGHLLPGLGSNRDLAIEAMNGVLGGTFTARINMNLREEKGWSYGARTQLQNAKGMRPFLVNAPVQTDRTADSLAELVKELDAIDGARPITQAEMDRVIAGLVRGLPGRFETSNAVLGSIVTSARYGRPLDYAATLTEQYEALRLADLQAAARDLLHPQGIVWLIVGDVAKIRESVAALKIAPVEVWTDDGEPVR